jgi:hypothetical protein
VIGIVIGIILFLVSIVISVVFVVPSWQHAHAVIEETQHPRPDYCAIARMEHELFGQTWHDPFNPHCQCDNCSKRQPIYGNTDLVRPPKQIQPDWHDREYGPDHPIPYDPSDTSGITEDWYGH